MERDTILHHGDRLVVGGNHYFRISNPTCPVQDTSFVDQPVDYNFAHLEIQKVQEERYFISGFFKIHWTLDKDNEVT